MTYKHGIRISKDESTGLKGLLAILVMLCHCRSYIHAIDGHKTLGQVLIAFGFVSVGVFFFISGYGVQESCDRKPDYIKRFPRNRILPLYLKYLILVICYAVLLAIGGVLKKELLLPSLFIFGGGRP